jgi:hypothetical protein
MWSKSGQLQRRGHDCGFFFLITPDADDAHREALLSPNDECGMTRWLVGQCGCLFTDTPVRERTCTISHKAADVLQLNGFCFYPRGTLHAPHSA